MLIVGITGRSGSGKSTALEAIKSLGGLALDCDAIYHELLRSDCSLKNELNQHFPGVLKENAIDRKRLGDIVFNSPDALLKLNEITHKYVKAEVRRRLQDWDSEGGALAAIDAIALIESGIDGLCDIVIGIIAPKELCIQRITGRDGISPDKAMRRLNAQKEERYFEDNCDYVVHNTADTPNGFIAEIKKIIGGHTAK